MENTFIVHYKHLRGNRIDQRYTAQMARFGEKTREARMRYARSKDGEYIGRRMQRVELRGNGEGLKGD